MSCVDCRGILKKATANENNGPKIIIKDLAVLERLN